MYFVYDSCWRRTETQVTIIYIHCQISLSLHDTLLWRSDLHSVSQQSLKTLWSIWCKYVQERSKNSVYTFNKMHFSRLIDTSANPTCEWTDLTQLTYIIKSNMQALSYPKFSFQKVSLFTSRDETDKIPKSLKSIPIISSHLVWLRTRDIAITAQKEMKQ